MTPEEIRDASKKNFITDFEGIRVDSASLEDGFLIVGGYTALKVGTISSAISRQSDLEVIDLNGDPIATLCFTKFLGNIERTNLTRWQYVAFLSDAEFDELDDPRYTFKSDYLIVEEARLNEYLQVFKQSAPIWGRFSHELVPSLDIPTNLSNLVAIPNLKFPTSYHSEAFGRYLNANNPLERFLRLYQCVELLFDFIIFKRMKALNDDLSGFSNLLSEHGTSELERLKAIMNNYCGNPQALAEKMELSSGFQHERETIFQTHSKKGNPFHENKNHWIALKKCIDGACFNEPALKKLNEFKNMPSFVKFVTDLAAYWIYRVRSSIAHNRVGEFLLEDKNAPFVANFAEPLMLEAVIQIFANPKFNSL